jgi:hypothetical protein
VNKKVLHLFNKTLSLKQSERAALMLALMYSHDEEPTSDEALEVWKQVAQHRQASLDRGENSAVPWAEAKARTLAL